MTRRRMLILVPVILAGVTIALGGVFLKDVLATGRTIYTEIALFNQVLNLVKTYYVEETEADSLIQGAIVGMLEQLDPHSNYIDPKRFERMDERNRGSYSGVGISFAIRNNWLTVISPLEGGPSAKLGIRPGDIISHIEGESAFGIKESEVFEKLRGPRGTVVNVTIRRGGYEEPIEYEIERDDILIQSVPYAFMLDDEVGYVRMGRFSATTSDELQEALDKLDGLGMKKLILDLRHNSGGYLNQAVEVADKFLEGGKKIVYTQGRILGSSEEYFSTDQGETDVPIVVLINSGSASASEIVSGAIQDWDRGIVAGQTSFGKGLVQRQYPLPNNGALLLTVARYYTASGRLIQRPYEGGEREEYYRQAGGTQTDLNEAIDSDFEDLDAEPPPDSSERPIYHTLLQGRPVYGGGGITPDVEIELFLRSRLDMELTFQRKYFDYVNVAVPEKKVTWDGSFEEFLKSFTVEDEVLDDFRGYLEADSFAFEPDSFAVHVDEVRRGIRAELANHYWGDDARYQTLIIDDPTVDRALELMPHAEAILRESRRIEQQRAANED